MAQKEKMIKQGAEAKIYPAKWHGIGVVLKKRTVKGYRIARLDATLRKTRTKAEAKLIAEARACGVSTPIIYDIDTLESTITMERIEGITVKKLLDSAQKSDLSTVAELCRNIGAKIGALHESDIIHGDLTTSNMIIDCGGAPSYSFLESVRGGVIAARNSTNRRAAAQSQNQAGRIKLPKGYRIYFIDFSLGEKSREVEAKGADIHVLKEAFESAHSNLDCFKYVLEGYQKNYAGAKEVIAKIEEIAQRGRYT